MEDSDQISILLEDILANPSDMHASMHRLEAAAAILKYSRNVKLAVSLVLGFRTFNVVTYGKFASHRFYRASNRPSSLYVSYAKGRGRHAASIRTLPRRHAGQGAIESGHPEGINDRPTKATLAAAAFCSFQSKQLRTSVRLAYIWSTP